MPVRGWVESQSLNPGDVIETDTFSAAVVISLNDLHRREATYNFTVDEFHSYYVPQDKLLVHNQDENGKRKYKCVGSGDGEATKSGTLPKAPTGPGQVAKSERDPKGLFTPKERAAKRAEQNNQCANGCGIEIDASSSKGHHIKHHADGGPTNPANHAEVCKECHKDLHSK